MEMRIYTIHGRRRGSALRVVGEAGPLAVVPPLWAVWEGLWLTALAMIAALVAVAALHPLGLGIVWIGLAGLAFGDGDSLARAELRLRGWRELGVAQAASEEGAEELYLAGRAVSRQ